MDVDSENFELITKRPHTSIKMASDYDIDDTKNNNNNNNHVLSNKFEGNFLSGGDVVGEFSLFFYLLVVLVAFCDFIV